MKTTAHGTCHTATPTTPSLRVLRGAIFLRFLLFLRALCASAVILLTLQEAPASYFETCRITLPVGYETSDGPWPLLVFLHGSDRWTAGTGDGRVAPEELLAGGHLPLILAAPRCQPESYWEPDQLLELIDRFEESHRIDPDRIYVTGYELGGYGTWNIACTAPERFAAIAPICGFPFPSKAREVQVPRLRAVPIWAFHGTRDQTTWISLVEKTVQTIRERGGAARLTVVPETHDGDAWRKPYEDGSIVRWLLSKRRKAAMTTEWSVGVPKAGQQATGRFAIRGSDETCHYRLYLPAQYRADGPPLPLLFYMGERGEPGEDALDWIVADAGPPAIVLAPNWKGEGERERAKLLALVDHIQLEFAVDCRRICAGGVGKGAIEAWNLVVLEPERFAALVAVDGLPPASFRENFHWLARLQTRAYHHDQAAGPSFDYLTRYVELIGKGGSAELVFREKSAELASAEVFQSAGLWEWLVEQRQTDDHPAVAHWIGHTRGVFPPPREVVRLFEPVAVEGVTVGVGSRESREDSSRDGQVGKSISRSEMTTLLFRPRPMREGQRYPLIVWLHGHGWEELDLVAGHLKYVELAIKDPARRELYPFFILAPQCPKGRAWFERSGGVADAAEPPEVIDKVMQAVNELIETEPIDSERISLFGISSGASACWEMVMRYPGRFAAIAPCGGRGPSGLRPERCRGTRLWVTHSLFDNAVPIDEDRAAVVAMRQAGIEVRYTEPANGTHLCWYDAFDAGLVDWLVASRRSVVAGVSYTPWFVLVAVVAGLLAAGRYAHSCRGMK